MSDSFSRPSRDETLMITARVWSHRGTCSRLQVGCVISKGGRILVQGYNGVPAGLPHCVHTDNEPCTRAEHAERNAIAWAARNGVALKGAEMHITHMPCLACAMGVINAGIHKVTYEEPYRLLDGVDLLVEAGIEVRGWIDFEPKGV